MLMPYDPARLLWWSDKVSPLIQGESAAWPVNVTIDINHFATFTTPWGQKYLTDEYPLNDNLPIDELPEMLMSWGVKGVWIGYYGDPLIDNRTAILIDKLNDAGLMVGVRTQGLGLMKDEMLESVWGSAHIIEVDLGAATTETYCSIYKEASLSAFPTVLNAVSNVDGVVLVCVFTAYYKNLHEIVEAARVAKQAGFNGIHFKFFRDDMASYTPQAIKAVEGALRTAQELYGLPGNRVTLTGDDFFVSCDEHAFAEWKYRDKSFSPKQCISSMIVGPYLAPNGSVWVCPQNPLVIGSWDSVSKFNKLKKWWGSQAHIKKTLGISPKECVGCPQRGYQSILEGTDPFASHLL